VFNTFTKVAILLFIIVGARRGPKVRRQAQAVGRRRPALSSFLFIFRFRVSPLSLSFVQSELLEIYTDHLPGIFFWCAPACRSTAPSSNNQTTSRALIYFVYFWVLYFVWSLSPFQPEQLEINTEHLPSNSICRCAPVCKRTAPSSSSRAATNRALVCCVQIQILHFVCSLSRVQHFH